jgi:hypothetical protein
LAATAALGVAGFGLFGAVGPSGVTAGPAVIPPDLRARATAQGRVRVVVTLEVPPGAETESVKQSVIAAISHTRHEVLRALPGLPLLALDASPETLDALAASPAVRRVEADALSRPRP